MNKKRKKYMSSYNTRDITLEKKLELLSRFGFLNALSREDLQIIASKVYPRIIRPMEIFVEEDLDEHHAFFVYHGAVSIFRTTRDGEIINIDLLGAPELVGEMGLIDSKPSIASVMAIGETHALILSQEDYMEIVQMNPHISNHFLRLFADRLRDFNLYIEDLLSKNLYQRTWLLVQFLSNHFNNQEINLSHEELADLIWGSRSRVTEVLNQLESEGKVETTHRKIKVLQK